MVSAFLTLGSVFGGSSKGNEKENQYSFCGFLFIRVLLRVSSLGLVQRKPKEGKDKFRILTCSTSVNQDVCFLFGPRFRSV